MDVDGAAAEDHLCKRSYHCVFVSIYLCVCSRVWVCLLFSVSIFSMDFCERVILCGFAMVFHLLDTFTSTIVYLLALLSASAPPPAVSRGPRRLHWTTWMWFPLRNLQAFVCGFLQPQQQWLAEVGWKCSVRNVWTTSSQRLTAATADLTTFFRVTHSSRIFCYGDGTKTRTKKSKYANNKSVSTTMDCKLKKLSWACPYPQELSTMLDFMLRFSSDFGT